MLCCSCGSSSSEEEARGVLIKKIETKTGQKSGAPVPYPVPFTDGFEEKYICNECFLQTDTARMVGDYDQGNDIPPPDYEVTYAERSMPGLPPAFPRWR